MHLTPLAPHPLRSPLKAQLQAELASATDAEAEGIKAEFDAREKAFEHDLDHVQRDVHMMIECSYSTHRPASPRLAPPLLTHPSPPPIDFLSK